MKYHDEFILICVADILRDTFINRSLTTESVGGSVYFTGSLLSVHTEMKRRSLIIWTRMDP